jgi:outer membrane protein OmpA-like peptidoglycan-associated protein
MKIATYLLAALLIAALGAAAWFYLYAFQPMAADYVRMKAGMPELEKTKAEMKKYKEQEKKETAWINPVIDDLSAVLSDEIKGGKAEVLSADNKVVVNISEQTLYMPGSKTFTKDSPQLLAKLDSLLRNDHVKGKYIIIGNTTLAVPAQGQGRKKMPAKDARTLAAERSAELVKYLEKKGINQDALIAAAYSSKQPEVGFKIKDHKTVIIIENPPVVPVMATPQATAPEAQTKPAPTTKGSTTAASAAPAATPAPQAQPKPIPVQPAQPKSN